MGLESLLLDPPKPCTFAGTKRLSALPDVDRETKRLCTQPNQWPPGSAVLEMSSGHNSWEGCSITSNPEFSNAPLQYGIVLETDWSKAVPPGNFGGLDSTLNPPAVESDLFLFNSIPAQKVEMDMQRSQWADTLYHQLETPGSTNIFDLHYSFHKNKSITPSLELSQDPNFGYNGDLLQDWILPEPSYLPFKEPLIDAAPTWIDVPTEPGNTGEYMHLGSLTALGFETKEIAAKGVWMLGTSLEEEIGRNEDTSAYSSTMTGHHKNLLGKPTKNLWFHPKILTYMDRA